MTLSEFQTQLREGTAVCKVSYRDGGKTFEYWAEGVQVDLVWNVVFIPDMQWDAYLMDGRWIWTEKNVGFRVFPLEKCSFQQVTPGLKQALDLKKSVDNKK